MWFESIEKDQFLIYAQQQARLNTAYWIAAKASHLSENKKENTNLAIQMTRFKTKSDTLLEVAKVELDNQKGLAKDLTACLLNYTNWYCAVEFSKISELRDPTTPADIIPSDLSIAARESQFIREYTDMRPGDDLESEWDRGIDLIYQCIHTLDRYGTQKEQLADIRKKLHATKEIMQPGFKYIRIHCQSYAGHLGLEPHSELALSNQLILDYLKLFLAGYSFAKNLSKIILLLQLGMLEENSSEDTEKLLENFSNKMDVCFMHMYQANLDISQHIGEIIDPRNFGTQAERLNKERLAAFISE